MTVPSDARYVIVSGAGGGIGTQLLHELIGVGFNVVATDVSDERLGPFSEYGDKVLTHVADLAKPGQADRAAQSAVATWGPPFGLVNLAGNNLAKAMEDLTDEEWGFILNANLTTSFTMSRAVIPHMRAAGGGRIVHMSSILGMRGEANFAAYCAAKAGLIGLTRAMAVEFAADNILVNCVAPVVTLTERVSRLPSDHLARQLGKIPLGRFADIGDTTATIRWLLAAETAFYTGQTFSPNGGDTMP
jgi:NAD(P)-dependent dehydrogenase (short-subunit alcohol dehydrogenase family)